MTRCDYCWHEVEVGRRGKWKHVHRVAWWRDDAWLYLHRARVGSLRHP